MGFGGRVRLNVNPFPLWDKALRDDLLLNWVFVVQISSSK
jgi:hypothetical protein